MNLFTTGEFAEYTGTSAEEVRTLIRTGLLPAHETGGRFILDLDEIEDEASDILAVLLDGEVDSSDKSSTDDDETDLVEEDLVEADLVEEDLNEEDLDDEEELDEELDDEEEDLDEDDESY